ncbi:MAG: sugar ABC transporter substrate-binding protein [Lachnospiraceae bacterium]|jgi:ribose transport system substrate-binding protein|nr:sugar ABC transporter substrate-binding protein [Lachnospiraceae bacterium]
MKNNRKIFILTEVVLAAMVVVLAGVMFVEQTKSNRRKVSVIVQNSDDSQWSAFRYGLKMAAEDQGVEVFVASTGEKMTLEEEISAIKYEVDNGADAVIVQPIPGNDAALLKQLKKIQKSVPVMLIGDTVSEDGGESEFPITTEDNYAIGKALAEEVLKDYYQNLDDKILGIVSEAADSETVADRIKGFQDGIKDTGAEVRWSVSGLFGEAEENSLRNQPKVDIVIALDNKSLKTAAEYSAANNLHGALVFGIGSSTEVIYYLDTGVVECLVVPDEFNVGYQSLTEAAENMRHFFRKMENHTLSYTVVHKEELFSKENQEIIFTMSQ